MELKKEMHDKHTGSDGGGGGGAKNEVADGTMKDSDDLSTTPQSLSRGRDLEGSSEGTVAAASALGGSTSSSSSAASLPGVPTTYPSGVPTPPCGGSSSGQLNGWGWWPPAGFLADSFSPSPEIASDSTRLATTFSAIGSDCRGDSVTATAPVHAPASLAAPPLFAAQPVHSASSGDDSNKEACLKPWPLPLPLPLPPVVQPPANKQQRRRLSGPSAAAAARRSAVPAFAADGDKNGALVHLSVERVR